MTRSHAMRQVVLDIANGDVMTIRSLFYRLVASGVMS
jgi:hypothetical protein